MKQTDRRTLKHMRNTWLNFQACNETRGVYTQYEHVFRAWHVESTCFLTFTTDWQYKHVSKEWLVIFEHVVSSPSFPPPQRRSEPRISTPFCRTWVRPSVSFSWFLKLKIKSIQDLCFFMVFIIQGKSVFYPFLPGAARAVSADAWRAGSQTPGRGSEPFWTFRFFFLHEMNKFG